VFLAVMAGAPSGSAQELALTERSDFWDLRIGVHWTELPQDFQEFACGTNGGPPSIPLSGFGEFVRCAAEATGLHEVQFRYDDTLEYWARAMEATPLIERYAGTRLFTYPVILSALFDDEGIVRGLRAVSDDRVPDRTRQLAYSLANTLHSFLGAEDWTCVDIPAGEGEEPMAGRLIKQDCWKQLDDGRLALTHSRLLLRPGQTLLDPADNRVRTGYFNSVGRLELYDPAVGVAPPGDGVRD
jgi:hypothetical protein